MMEYKQHLSDVCAWRNSIRGTKEGWETQLLIGLTSVHMSCSREVYFGNPFSAPIGWILGAVGNRA